METSSRAIRSKTTKTIAVVTAGVLVVALWWIAGPIAVAPAHFNVGSTSVSINHDGTRFFGQISSNRRRCKRGRVVRVVRVRRNRPDRVIARDRTNRFGNWAVRRPRARGRFQARVSRTRNTSYGHDHRCRGDRSPVIRVR